MADRSFKNNNLVHFRKDERHEILIQLLVSLVEPSKKVVVFCWGGGSNSGNNQLPLNVIGSIVLAVLLNLQ